MKRCLLTHSLPNTLIKNKNEVGGQSILVCHNVKKMYDILVHTLEVVMALGKQAKTLTDKQVKVVLRHIAEAKDPVRNKVFFLLGLDAAL